MVSVPKAPDQFLFVTEVKNIIRLFLNYYNTTSTDLHQGWKGPWEMPEMVYIDPSVRQVKKIEGFIFLIMFQTNWWEVGRVGRKGEEYRASLGIEFQGQVGVTRRVEEK